MGDHIDEEEDTLSLSGLQSEDDNMIRHQEGTKSNQSSSSSSSSSSVSSFEQDFLGFFSEEWSRDPSYNTSPENIIFCGKIVSSKPYVSHVVRNQEYENITGSQTSSLFRSTSDSFRFMKTASRQRTPRSNSLPDRSSSSSSCKSKWQVFMFGFGSGTFQNTMDMSDIKNRQLRRQFTVKVDDGKEVGGGRKSGKKGWWRLVDVLGCHGGYERDIMVVI
ncbi:hypothetical protein R6Q59_014486 [Mikania micrantha]